MIACDATCYQFFAPDPDRQNFVFRMKTNGQLYEIGEAFVPRAANKRFLMARRLPVHLYVKYVPQRIYPNGIKMLNKT